VLLANTCHGPCIRPTATPHPPHRPLPPRLRRAPVVFDSHFVLADTSGSSGSPFRLPRNTLVRPFSKANDSRPPLRSGHRSPCPHHQAGLPLSRFAGDRSHRGTVGTAAGCTPPAPVISSAERSRVLDGPWRLARSGGPSRASLNGTPRASAHALRPPTGGPDGRPHFGQRASRPQVAPPKKMHDLSHGTSPSAPTCRTPCRRTSPNTHFQKTFRSLRPPRSPIQEGCDTLLCTRPPSRVE
jgi:hypothetical protein